MTDWRSRQRADADAGFTLIEAVAAIAVAAIMLTAIAFAAVTGIHASTEARINQQAGDVIESAIESARAQSFSSLEMSPATTDPNLTTGKDSRLSASGCPNGGSLCISVPNDNGSGTVKESLDIQAGGYITNHIQTDTTGTNKVPFTVSSYITSPSDEAGATYKRFVVFVQWHIYGATHTREASTFITDTTRGLPLPHFTLTAANSTTPTVNPGTTVTFGFTVENLGARDSFKFTDNSGLWTYYLDNGDGVFDPSTDTKTTDTGQIDPNKSVEMWATYTVPTTATAGSTTIKFTATSDAQPGFGAGTSSHSVTATVTVNTGVISPTPTPTTPSPTPTSPSPTPTTPSPTPTNTPSCPLVGARGTIGTEYWLRAQNSSTPFNGSTGLTSMDPMQFSASPATATALQNYSTEVSGSQPGRNLSPFSGTPSLPAGSPSDVSKAAQWQFLVSSTSGISYTANGYVYLDFWAMPTDAVVGEQMSFEGMVGYGAYSKNKGYSWTQEATGTISTASSCGAWQEFVVAMQLPAGKNKNSTTSTFSAGTNDIIEVLLYNTGTKSDRLAYDANVDSTSNSYQSNVLWPQQ